MAGQHASQRMAGEHGQQASIADKQAARQHRNDEQRGADHHHRSVGKSVKQRRQSECCRHRSGAEGGKGYGCPLLVKTKPRLHQDDANFRRSILERRGCKVALSVRTYCGYRAHSTQRPRSRRPRALGAAVRPRRWPLQMIQVDFSQRCRSASPGSSPVSRATFPLDFLGVSEGWLEGATLPPLPRSNHPAHPCDPPAWPCPEPEAMRDRASRWRYYGHRGSRVRGQSSSS